jgi:hypothetical protein
VRASNDTVVVSLPATTSAFAAANIFARASGYIEKRNTDIGDRNDVVALVALTPPLGLLGSLGLVCNHASTGSWRNYCGRLSIPLAGQRSSCALRFD